MAHDPRKRGKWVRLRSQDIFRSFIKDRKLSYKQVGDMAGCHKSMIGQLVNGDRTTCTEDLALSIARVFNVPMEALFVPSPSAISSRNDKRRQAREDAA
jgi:Helix-turn-helix.